MTILQKDTHGYKGDLQEVKKEIGQRENGARTIAEVWATQP